MTANFFKKILIFLFLILVLFGVNKYFLNNLLQNTIFNVYSRFGGPLDKGAIALLKYFRSLAAFNIIVGENNSLRRENNELIGKLAEMEKIQRQNELLRNQLNISPDNKRQLLMAKIISISRNSSGSSLIIDKGSKDDIKKSMAVVANGNILAGVINQAFDDYSIVILLDDPHSAVSVRVGKSNIIGVAQGVFGSLGEVSLGFITNKDVVENEDLISTSGLDGLPEALPVAKVNSIKLKGGSLFKEIRAKLLFDISSGPEFFVILR